MKFKAFRDHQDLLIYLKISIGDNSYVLAVDYSQSWKEVLYIFREFKKQIKRDRYIKKKERK